MWKTPWPNGYSALDSGSSGPGSSCPGSSGPGSSAGEDNCVVFLGKTLYSYSAQSLNRSINGYRRQNAGDNLQ